MHTTTAHLSERQRCQLCNVWPQLPEKPKFNEIDYGFENYAALRRMQIAVSKAAKESDSSS